MTRPSKSRDHTHIAHNIEHVHALGQLDIDRSLQQGLSIQCVDRESSRGGSDRDDGFVTDALAEGFHQEDKVLFIYRKTMLGQYRASIR
jgi:hypothetical protein